MLLCLVRHGIAVDRNDPSCPPDAERPLTDKGAARTREAMKGLAALGFHPDMVCSSPYLRARQTAEIASRALALSPKKIRLTEALLPDAPPAALLAELASLKPDAVLCAGHAPHLDLVVGQVLTGRAAGVTSLRKAGAALLELRSTRRGDLVWLLEPSMLRALG